MAHKNELSQEELKGLLSSDYDIGHFTRLRHPQVKRIGTRAGDLTDSNYRYITIAGKKHKEHRLVWLYHYGSFPVGDIMVDHIDSKL